MAERDGSALNARVEQRVLRQLREAQRDLARLESVLLDAFARDDVTSVRDSYLASQVRDPVHDEVLKVVSCISGEKKSKLRGIAELAGTALVAAKHVVATQPAKASREYSLTDCMACGKPCAPAPKSGLCPDECFPEWRSWGRRHPGKDRHEFANWVKSGRPDA